MLSLAKQNMTAVAEPKSTGAGRTGALKRMCVLRILFLPQLATQALKI